MQNRSDKTLFKRELLTCYFAHLVKVLCEHGYRSFSRLHAALVFISFAIDQSKHSLALYSTLCAVCCRSVGRSIDARSFFFTCTPCTQILLLHQLHFDGATNSDPEKQPSQCIENNSSIRPGSIIASYCCLICFGLCCSLIAIILIYE